MTAINTLIAAQMPANAAESLARGISAEDLEAREAKREAVSRELLRASRREDGLRRWETFFPPALRASDWSHPGLAPCAQQIAAVLAYQVGAKGILATGPSGRGKTRSMAALMRRLGPEEGNDVRYWSAAGWFSTLQSFLEYGNDHAKKWVDTVASRHVVFFDDYGQEAMQVSRREWAQAWFFHFLDQRVALGLPLFLTTNLSAREMMSHAGHARGDPLVRRLLDVADPISFR